MLLFYLYLETKPQLQAWAGARRFESGFKMAEIHHAKVKGKASRYEKTYGYHSEAITLRLLGDLTS